jgi:hypothetical protein
MTNKIVHVVGGGTRFHIDSHLYLGSKALGNTARLIADMCNNSHHGEMDVKLHLTAMAEPWVKVPEEERNPPPYDGPETERNRLDTNEDLKKLVGKLIADHTTKIIFFNPAIVDFDAKFAGLMEHRPIGTRIGRLRTKDFAGKPLDYELKLTPSEKIVRMIRKDRKDIFLVAFKQTSGATPQEQYRQGLDMLKAASANLVLANDSETRLNMIIVPEEATYSVTKDREAVLRELVDMAYLRSHLTFTRSTVVAGEPVAWESPEVPASLRKVVDHCITRGAYKKVRGVTAGHFAVKLDDTTFLTSRRKTDFNDMSRVGLVKVKTDGPDSVIAYGSKPSVGGQSQRIVFTEHPDADCIVHFHCEKKTNSTVPTISQREYECGSHECGRNTSRGLARFGNLWAVYLDSHGPNIVFNKATDPKEVIDFIEANFDLDTKTGGYAVA